MNTATRIAARKLLIDTVLPALVQAQRDATLAGPSVTTPLNDADTKVRQAVAALDALVIPETPKLVTKSAKVPVQKPGKCPDCGKGVWVVGGQGKCFAHTATAKPAPAAAKAEPKPVVKAEPIAQPTCDAPTKAGTPCKRPVVKAGDRCSMPSHQAQTAMPKPAAKPAPAAAKVNTNVATVPQTVDLKAQLPQMTRQTRLGMLAQLSDEQHTLFLSLLTEGELFVALTGHARQAS